MRNMSSSGTEALLNGFSAALKTVGARSVIVERQTGSNVDAEVRAQFGSVALVLDAAVKLTPPRTRAAVGAVPSVQSGRVPVIVAPFLSPPVRDELARAGWSYWDATGNMRISSNSLAVWIDRVGASRDPEPRTDAQPQRLRSLKGKAASQVIVRLLSTRREASVRELSRETGTGVGTVSRVVELLREEGLLEDTNGGPIVVADQLELAQRWARDYGFETTFKPARYFSLLGEEIALDRLQRSGLTYALTGTRAAAIEFETRGRVAPLPASDIWLYTDDVTGVERAMDLAPDRRGNVLVARCDFLTLDEGFSTIGGSEPRKIVRPWRVVGDLLGAGGRLAAVGEELAAIQPRGVAV
ncbi:MAG: ArsR family transcriptional regulator [Candidatus Microbacterium phytovorans]|uniref:ArsR family transcriptional regulator n=1 Tax=Candidatus Microbacterium phytovorans TaxID=3121374 RepID=A0AAJ6B5B2_9MICO|nr:ArsR family transcriptional regulator [Microbacterium sp.]WEK13641.1 MAG: ArsR family transcriptional regulator [Microbacterium sp.]